MSIVKGWLDIRRIITEGARDQLEEPIDAARKAYCNLYTNSPSWIFMKNNLIVPIVTRSLNSLCSDFPPPPPPPPPPFTGGQCFGVDYTLVVSCIATNRFQPDPLPRTVNLVTVKGVVDALDYTSTANGQLIDVEIYRNGSAVPQVQRWNLGSGWSVVEGTVEYALNRKDGQPDVCGDPEPPGYPDIPPPTPEDAADIITITNNEGDSYDYSTTINYDPDGTFVFPPVINVGGVSVTIDVGGITVDRSSTNFSGGGGGSGGDTFGSDVKPPPPPEVEEKQEEQEEGVENTVGKLIAIVVSLTAIPGDTSVTDGRGAPDVYYAGWVEFKNKGKYYPRQFIHFKESRFQAPDGNDGYAVTYSKGFAGVITEITTQETV
jgi:hypothetical protein